MNGRLVLFVLAMALWAVAISARLVQLQVIEHEGYLRRALDQQQKTVELAPPRGTIFDSHGRKLALSVAVDSAFVLPREVADPDAAAKRIGEVLGLAPAEVLERLTAERRWVWLARQLDPPVAEALRALEIHGLDFVSESKRFYPLEHLAGPVLGFVGTDHSGLAGLEATYDRVVSGEPVRRQLLRDALDGRVVAPGFSFMDAKPGADLHLTIDATVQFIVEDELAQALERTGAKAGTAVVMRPGTGAILAMASLPAFDPNRFGEYDERRWRNAVVESAYEPGSTFKAVVATAALDRDLVDPMDVIDCEDGGITLGSLRIRDHKPFGLLTFRDVIARSSNVGVIKTGLRLERSELFDATRDFGFGVRTGVDLPGESAGILRPVERWSRYEAAYLSIGQGVSVTPLQMVRAFAALANGGYLVEPHLVRAIDPDGHGGVPKQIAPGDPIATSATLRSMTRLLEAVVEVGGGKAAAVPGYRVAGKTGTAQKPGKGGYLEKRHIASFAGFVPSRQPEVVALVTLDEPKGKYYGGEVAAPVFGAIMAKVLPYLGVAPASLEERRVQSPRPAGALRARAVEFDSRARGEAGAIPDLSGLTAREAIRLLAERGLSPRLHGSGFVHKQAPAPGLPVEQAQGEVEIWLGTRS
ncbi:MAG: penicillin-binding protein [Thermoanaerobaculia bacterium]